MDWLSIGILTVGVMVVVLLLSGKTIIIGHVSHTTVVVHTNDIKIEVLTKDEGVEEGS